MVARRFPLHSREHEAEYNRAGETSLAELPSVTLLKPLKGWEPTTEACLRSWLELRYPSPIQVLFGVASPSDPAVEGVRRLIESHPGCNARLVLCQKQFGVNAKVSTLIHLLREAEHEVIAVSDADVMVPPDFMVNAVVPLRDPEVGLVHSFYRMSNPTTLAMQCEAVAINGDFWSQVLQSQSLRPVDFALGAVMITRQEQLKQIGGFEFLVDHLADDFHLGHQIARGGQRVMLCPVVVDCVSPPMGWKEVWNHQLRWSRTIRVCRPLPYALSIIGNATLWPLLWLASQPAPAVLGTVGCFLVVRIVLAQNLQSRLHPEAAGLRYFWLVPVKDLLQFALWFFSFVGTKVVWRGKTFRVQPDGKLVPA